MPDKYIEAFIGSLTQELLVSVQDVQVRWSVARALHVDISVPIPGAEGKQYRSVSAAWSYEALARTKVMFRDFGKIEAHRLLMEVIPYGHIE